MVTSLYIFRGLFESENNTLKRSTRLLGHKVNGRRPDKWHGFCSQGNEKGSSVEEVRELAIKTANEFAEEDIIHGQKGRKGCFCFRGRNQAKTPGRQTDKLEEIHFFVFSFIPEKDLHITGSFLLGSFYLPFLSEAYDLYAEDFIEVFQKLLG